MCCGKKKISWIKQSQTRRMVGQGLVAILEKKEHEIRV